MLWSFTEESLDLKAVEFVVLPNETSGWSVDPCASSNPGRPARRPGSAMTKAVQSRMNKYQNTFTITYICGTLNSHNQNLIVSRFGCPRHADYACRDKMPVLYLQPCN